MPPKAALSMTPASSAGNNTGMAGILDPDLQVVTIGQLRVVMEQINIDQEAFNNKLKSIKTKKVKLLVVK